MIPEDPNVIMLEDEDEGPQEVEEISEAALGAADVGDVQMISDVHSFPDDWHALDGSVLESQMYPEYAAHLRIQGPTFVLPQAKSPNGYVFITRLGKKVPSQVERHAALERLRELPEGNPLRLLADSLIPPASQAPTHIPGVPLGPAHSVSLESQSMASLKGIGSGSTGRRGRPDDL